MTESYPQYFCKCNVCAFTDAGQTFYDYEIVDCPSCGSGNMTRWEAKPNLSREWAYCETFGHDWQVPPGKQGKNVEACTRCSSTRDFNKKKVEAGGAATP